MVRMISKTNPHCDGLSATGYFTIRFCCLSKRYDQFQTGIISRKSFGLCHPVRIEKIVIINLSALIVMGYTDT